MKKLTSFACFLAVSLFFASPIYAQAPQTLQGQVTHTEDGDTIHVLLTTGRKIKVRFWGIDAPEVCHEKVDSQCAKPTQPFGHQATSRMTSLVSKSAVTLVCNGKQSHDRSVCLVYRNGADMGLQLVKDGLAHHDAKYLGDPDYAQAHRQAQQAKIGLWSSASMVTPKVWRDMCWKNKICPT